jgi:hypothetical protein
MRSSEGGGVHSRQGGSGTCSKQCKGGGAASTAPSMLGVYNHLPCLYVSVNGWIVYLFSCTKTMYFG